MRTFVKLTKVGSAHSMAKQLELIRESLPVPRWEGIRARGVTPLNWKFRDEDTKAPGKKLR